MSTIDTSSWRLRQPEEWVYAKLFLGHESESAQWRGRLADRVLLKHIRPLFADWQDRGLNAFFIRYHEDGYHLRLRVHVADTGERERIREALRQQLDGLRPQGMHWLWGDYAPEIEKYGGPLGNHWAEQHFQASSELVIELLRRLRLLPVSERQAMQSQLGLCLMHATLFGAGLSERHTAMLCQGYYRYWWKHLADYAPADALEPVYQRHRGLLAHCLGDGSAQGLSGSEWARQHAEWLPLIHGWSAQLRADIDVLGTLERAGRLQRPDWLADGALTALGGDADRRCTLLAILPNYLHMLNNRLGVHVAHEGRLAYCLMRHLEQERGFHAPALELLLQP